MSVQRIQIFLASRFGEFADLRRILCERIARIQSPALEPVDLNDNIADTRPPLARCLDAVARADIFILLVGETYGERPPNAELSYTHLEYQKAVEDDTKVILPFFVGTDYRERLRQRNEFPKELGRWQQEITDSHTVAFLDRSKTDDELAFEVFTSLYSRLWETLSGGEDLKDDVVNDSESSIWEYSPIPLSRLSEPVSSGPLHQLAADHAREAQKGLELGLRRIGVEQLKKAVDYVPLHAGWSYWLGRLLVASGRKDACRRGLELARTAAHVSGSSPVDPRDGTASKVQTMAALALAARASERLGDAAQAFRFATEAYQVTDWHWFANLELARQHAIAQRASDALALVARAFWQRPDCLNQVVNDDVFKELGEPYDEFRRELKELLQTRLDDIRRCRDEAVALLVRARTTVNAAIDSSVTYQVSVPERLSILGVVREIRRNTEFTRATLQEVARLVVQTREATRTWFGGHVGESTKAQLTAQVAASQLRIQVLESQQSRALGDKAQAETRQNRAIVVMAVSILSTMAYAYAFQSPRDGPPWIFGVAIIVCVFAFRYFGRHNDREKAATKEASTLEAPLKQERDLHAKATTDLERHGLWWSALREIVEQFSTVVVQFEKLSAERRLFSSAVAIRRAKAGDVVTVRSDGDGLADLGLTLELDLLPAALAELKPSDAPPAPRLVFARLGPQGRLSRVAAYFD